MKGLAILFFAIACNLFGAPQQGAASVPPADHRATLNKYCVTCHNEKLKSGNLVLSSRDVASVNKDPETWEKVVRKLRMGAMPPAGLPRPEKVVTDNLAAWLETELDSAALEDPNPGRPSLQRLNRSEYRNAIRDLLALEIDAESMLPADAAGFGFDNNADALTLSPALTERYLGTAAKISQMALARPRGLPTPETYFVPTDRNQAVRVGDALPFGSRGGLAVRHNFPANGEYLFEMKPKESGVAGGFEGITEEPHRLEVRIDNATVWTGTVGGPEFALVRRVEGGDPERNKKIVERLRFSVPVKAGSHLVQAYFVAKTAAYVEDLFDPALRREPYRDAVGQPKLSTLTVTGPQTGTAAVAETPSRRKILQCSPASAKDEVCAGKIISNLAGRAYRRTVTDADLAVPLASFKDGAARGGFEPGIEMALRSILVSPKFLFRFEDQPAGLAADAPYRISDLELACGSRSSYGAASLMRNFWP